MSEWWSYTLSDFLLFSPRTYYRLFELYNDAIWPLQILGLALGLTMLVLLLRGGTSAARIVLTALALCWLFVAAIFHWQRYATINWAATYFALAFALQAFLLLWAAWRATLTRNTAAIAVFVFALAVQPLIGPWFGRPWAQMEMFGTAPDPTAIATLGLLAMTAGRHVWLLWIVPLVWCAVTGLTLWTMEAPDALVAPLAAGIAVGAGWIGRRGAGR